MGNAPSNEQDVQDEQDEEIEEPEPEPTVEQLPELLERASDSDIEIKWKALCNLERVRCGNPDEATEPLIPFVLALIPELPALEDENVVIASVDLVCNMMTSTPASTEALLPHLEALIPFIAGGKSNVATYNQIYSSLEELLEADESLSSRLLPRIASVIQDSPDDQTTKDLLNGIYVCAVYGRSHCSKLLLQAGIFDLAQASTASASSETVSAAADISGHYLSDEGFQTQVKTVTGKITAATKADVILTFIDTLYHPNPLISAIAVEKLTALEDADKELLLALGKQRYWVALVLRLQYKDPDVYGASEEWALARQMESEEPASVVDAFCSVWTGDYTIDTKLGVAGGLALSFDGIRNAAFEAGFIHFILSILKGPDEDKAVRILSILTKMVADNQRAGIHLLTGDGVIDQLIPFVASPNSEIRNDTLRSLASLCDSFTSDADSLRDVAKTAFSTPNNLSLIVGALYHDDKTTANYAAILLAEMMLNEDGTESWSYDSASSDPPPPTPFKDQIFTAELVHHVIGLLQYKESSKGAFYLLCYGCWGSDRTLELVKTGFQSYVDSADVSFFSALHHPNVRGSHISRVAEAAAYAGAMPRVLQLLKEQTTKESQRAAVDGLSNLLMAPSADKDMLYGDASLPGAMAALLADEDEDSLTNFLWMSRQLSKNENEWIGEGKWAVLGGDDIVAHLVSMLEVKEENLAMEEPDESAMEMREYRKAQKEYKEAVTAAEEKPGRILEKVLSAIEFTLAATGLKAEAFIRPLMTRTSESPRILGIIDNIVLLEGFDSTVLVDSMNDILATAESWDMMEEWCNVERQGIPAAVLKTTALERLVGDVGGEDEDSIDPAGSLVALAAMVKISPPDYVKKIKDTFFGNPRAVKDSLLIAGGAAGDGYIADSATNALFTLAADYPEGIKVLASPELFEVALTRFDDEENGSGELLAPLIGYACENDEEALGRVREMVKGYLEALQVPPEVKGGGKKKKQKKVKQARMGFYETWRRMRALVRTTPAARKVLLEAGAVGEVKRVLESAKDEDDKETAIRFLRELVNAHPEEGHAQRVLPVLPAVKVMWEEEVGLSAVVLFLKEVDVRVLLGDEVGMEVARLVVRSLGENPSSFDQSALFEAAVRVAGDEVGYGVVVDTLRECFEADDERVVKYEMMWGYSHPVQVLARDGPDVARRALEDAGAVEFVLRLVGMDSFQAVANGAESAVALIEHVEGMKQRLVGPVLEVLKVRVGEARKARGEAEGRRDDEEGTEEYSQLVRQVEVIERVLGVLGDLV